MATTFEKRGDVILGAHLVHCHHDIVESKGRHRLVRSPLRAGRGGPVVWTETWGEVEVVP